MGARVRLHAQGALGFAHASVVGEVARGADAEIAGLWTQVEAGVALRLE